MPHRLLEPRNALGRMLRLGALVVLGTSALAQGGAFARLAERRDVGYVALRQATLDATTDTLALVVASHPDDRYVLPAAYLRFRLGYRVAILLFTRGGGGQNSSGPETGDALARLRTIESEACAAHFGARVYYLNRPDNGFSRSGEETLQEWGEEESARDCARLLREIRPDVVLTTHHPDEEHGHDIALLRILTRSLTLAKDASLETAGAQPFDVRRALRGATASEEDAIAVSLPMDAWEPLRGGTIRQLAYRALREHRSQFPLLPMESLLQPILVLAPLLEGPGPRPRSIADGLGDFFTAWQSEREGPPPIRADELAELRESKLPPARLAARAIALHRKLAAVDLPAGSELDTRRQRRLAALSSVILRSAGITVFMNVPEGVEAAPGHPMPLQIWIGNEGGHRVSGIRVEAVGGVLELVGPGRDRESLDPQESVALEARYVPPEITEADLSRLFARDTFVAPLQVRFRFSIDGVPVVVQEVVPTNLKPALKVTVSPKTLLLPAHASEARFVVGIERKSTEPTDVAVRVKAPAGTRVPRGIRKLHLDRNERYAELTFTLEAPNMPAGVSAMHVHVDADGRHTRLRANVHKVEVHVADGLRVGLITGVDDTAQEVLEALIGQERLRKFEPGRPLPILDDTRLSTIVVDIRAMRSTEVRTGFARLLAFVERGGRLVVFYHKDQEFNVDAAYFRGAPYPLVIGKGRVTRQDAPVRILRPKHSLLTFPNVIRPEDWDDWKQERGLYFPAKYDPAKFEEILEMYDPGQPAERGSLLFARYGKGDYVYCALSLYRQLKNRHAGACRLFANLISPSR